ncbi:MAG TPA: OPT/YSL family transporter, partial [Thermoanaerobaculia bacterium]|nr:OPT/YSL family transporter [Thermoanaerobaculia bacterium]
MSGEQFELPEAIERMREIRRTPAEGRAVIVSAGDPLNLTGIVTSGDRVRAITATRIAYRDGVAVSMMEGDEPVVEFTARAVVFGLFFGILFGAANAYLGLRVGLTVSTSIPIAVLTVAFLRIMPRKHPVILEANLSQTIGSASSSLATGTIFTIPALFLWGFAPPFWQVALLALLGGCLGIAAMVPLRRLLIVRAADELPYPEGT